ncbi:unnamed protein product [Prunus armeniaca]
MLGELVVSVLPIMLQGSVIVFQFGTLGRHVVLALCHFGDVDTKALYFDLAMWIDWRFPLRGLPMRGQKRRRGQIREGIGGTYRKVGFRSRTDAVPGKGSPMLKSPDIRYMRGGSGILHRVSMCDFVQVAVVVTHVRGLAFVFKSFGNYLRQAVAASEEDIMASSMLSSAGL